METTILPSLEPIHRLTKDLRQAATTLTTTEVRFLVDLYYQIQDFRKASGNQIASMGRDGEPVAVLGWAHDTMTAIEKEIQKWLDLYTDKETTGIGLWAKSICGIGPIISAGLLAHIDMQKAPTVGHIWSFAGLNPTAVWNKGEKRPHNAALKVLCWKIGQSFMKVQNNDKDIYGKIYAERKLVEQSRNEAGSFADQAAAALEKKKFKKTTEAYKHYSSGKLSPAHIDARARRYAVKLFLSHWHAEAYRRTFGKEPPLPYPIAHLGHVHLK